jgi:hypothetical protein
MVPLIGFTDGLQLSHTCAALEASGIDLAIQETVGDPTTGRPTSFEIWVDEADYERSKNSIREKLGVFSLALDDEVQREEPMEVLTDGVVGQFESRQEAAEAEALLIEAGFAARVEVDAEDEDGTTFTVKVEPHEQERALVALAERLGLG